MQDNLCGVVDIYSESDIIAVRRIVRDAAKSLNFSLTDVTRTVTAASELARNIYLYAGSGKMKWRFISKNKFRGIELVFEDKGPGIINLELALQEGYSTGKGFGLGLSGAKKLMDEMEIRTGTGEGTTITIRKWLRSL
jgi:serine/threonine-protein kinase RsbT